MAVLPAGASVVVTVTFVPGAVFARLHDVGDSGVRVARPVSGTAGVVDSPSSACVPRKTSKPDTAGVCSLEGQDRVVMPLTRSCDRDITMSLPSPLNTWTALLFEADAVALLVQVVSMLQRACTR